ncbi:MAG: hypothetical protein LIO90_08915 [Bacteroidales bacterium]|nr:hypothetical protein [Bacteroidales bacterium]
MGNDIEDKAVLLVPYAEAMQGEAVRDYPEAYKRWCRDNAETIDRRWSEGKANPYFIEHNREVYQKIVDGYDFEKDMVSTGNGGNKPPKDNATALGGDGDDGGVDGERRRRIEEHRNQYERIIESHYWDGLVFDDETGGYVVAHRDHNFAHTKPKGAILTGGEAEKEVAKLLAALGKQIKLLSERLPQSKKPADMEFDGLTWDVKYIPTANEETIRKYIRDGRKADCVIFYAGHKNRKADIASAYHRELGRANKQRGGLPKIYFINTEGILEGIKKPPE